MKSPQNLNNQVNSSISNASQVSNNQHGIAVMPPTQLTIQEKKEPEKEGLFENPLSYSGSQYTVAPPSFPFNQTSQFKSFQNVVPALNFPIQGKQKAPFSPNRTKTKTIIQNKSDARNFLRPFTESAQFKSQQPKIQSPLVAPFNQGAASNDVLQNKSNSGFSSGNVIQREIDLDKWFKDSSGEGGQNLDTLGEENNWMLYFFKQMQETLANPEIGTQEGILEREVKIKAHQLSQQRENIGKPRNEIAKMALEEVLNEDEAEWMEEGETEVPRVGGIENNSQFLGRIRSGQKLVDKGAATSHGEHAHRIQWYMIKKDFEARYLDRLKVIIGREEEFQDADDRAIEREARETLNFGLLEMYKEMGNTDHVRKLRAGGGSGEFETSDNIDEDETVTGNIHLPLWSAILDVRGSHDRDAQPRGGGARDPRAQQFHNVGKAAPVNLTGDFTLNPNHERHFKEAGTRGFLAEPHSDISIALLDTRIQKYLQDGQRGDYALRKALEKLDDRTIDGYFHEARVGGTMLPSRRMKVIQAILNMDNRRLNRWQE